MMPPVARLQDIIANVLVADRKKDDAKLRSQSRKASSPRAFMSIPKLEDAVQAGKRRAADCMLILTEGDSAKALAVAGFEVVGRTLFGVYPLRGKLLNTRDVSARQLSDNAEISAVCKILGLQFGRKYSADPRKTLPLRYGRVLIMADQDHDGTHIKGLILNFFQHYWPELLERGDLIGEFRTPVLKATPTSAGKGTEPMTFYSVPEYDAWYGGLDQAQRKRWRIKYYKGLGTSSAAEAKHYFSNLDRHVSIYAASDAADAEAIDMAFSKDRAADRREWLASTNFSSFDSPDDDANTGIESFVNSELILFAYADNQRSIPSAIDGLKPSQRKVLFACFKRNLVKEIKVAQLSGYVAEHTAYHHGEASLQSTIIGMAQDFVGANNLPLLATSGQFGTRHHGGKDAASSRYIYTHLSPCARWLYPEADDDQLQRCIDDGMMVEPRFFVPVIPMLLVNGSQGIGTGWSTTIPKYNPLDVIGVIEQMLDGKSPRKNLVPWIRGFDGGMTKLSKGRYQSTGVVGKVSTTSKSKTALCVSELPVGKWTSDYKTTLNGLIEKEIVRDYTEHHTGAGVQFNLKVPEPVAQLPKAKMLRTFKLTSIVAESNMHAFDADGSIKKYGTALEIAKDFFPVRLALYVKQGYSLDGRLLGKGEGDPQHAI